MSAVNLAASLPRVILMGRPNVGKSTLFNRLIRSREGHTHDRPGVTRDRMEGTVRGRGKVPFILVDTGGRGPWMGTRARWKGRAVCAALRKTFSGRRRRPWPKAR